MEYTVLVTVIIGAFIAGGVYFKRGLQGRWKASIDDLGEQYDPRVTNTDIIQRLSQNTELRINTIDAEGGVWTMREDITNSLETKTGFSRIGATN